MSIGQVFTNSIVREIGRNYGKSISNSLLNNSNYTPIHVNGDKNDITRKRGLKYENKLDELIKNLTIKGATATFNQGQNIFNAYFELVDEAKSDNVIDLIELKYLIQKIQDSTLALNKIELALNELGDI